METTTVVFQDDHIHGEVQLFSNEQKAGMMEISAEDGKLTVYHTEVNPEHEGKGFGKLLLDQLVRYARENNLKIVPLCPYVSAQFKRHPETFADVRFKPL
jgi:Predicted acetyltransferase